VARDFEGKCWSCEPPGHTNWGKKNDAAAWGITLLDCRISAPGLSTTQGEVHSGGNSGYQAINLAYLLGATRIILIGFDMRWTGGKAHWFGNHPEGLTNQEPDRYIKAFRTIKPDKYGLEIINCSRATALDAFPRRNLEDVL